MHPLRVRRLAAVVVVVLAAAACTGSREQATPLAAGRATASSAPGTTSSSAVAASASDATVGAPKPAAVVPALKNVVPSDATFAITAQTAIVTATAADDTRRIAEYLAALLRPSTGFPMPVIVEGHASGNIVLRSTGGLAGDEGYVLEVTADSVSLGAHEPAGLFHGVQTLRQLLPPQVESEVLQAGPWTLPGGRIEDSPRFPWRGAMLDVSRHFFDVNAVKRYIDDIALYKMNVLHLHLSDDQGWRVAIEKWPRLGEVGGRSQVGGGPGGFYTKADYAEIVAYAAHRYITVVPEIDMPGHTNAALSSYAELNCKGKAPKPYTGTEVGFSSLCVTAAATWAFIRDVVAELAAMTPGPYIHIGGDEVERLSAAEYAGFVARVEDVVAKNGKQVVGWAEIGKATILPTTVVQYWNTRASDKIVREAVARGARVLMSPASKTYLDMKYDERTELGLTWAGLIEVQDSWDWDPATLMNGVAADHIVGVEAPIWSETLKSIEDVETMAFPRLPAIAEVGWSAAEGRDWADFRTRLAAQAPRWKAMGLRYYPSPQIDWVQ